MTRTESADSTVVDPYAPGVLPPIRAHGDVLPPIGDELDPVGADDFVTVTKAEIARVSATSVLRVAALFWACAGATFFATLYALWFMLSTTGAITNFEHFVDDATGLKSFHVMSGTLLLALGLAVLVFVCIATVMTVAAALFYNALAALTGGVQVRAVVPAGNVVMAPDRVRRRR